MNDKEIIDFLVKNVSISNSNFGHIIYSKSKTENGDILEEKEDKDTVMDCKNNIYKMPKESAKNGDITHIEQDTVRKFLKRNNDIGYSKRWTEAQKTYADSIRLRYTK